MSDKETKQLGVIEITKKENGKRWVLKYRVSYHKNWGRSNFRGYIFHVDRVEKEDSGTTGVAWEKYLLGSSGRAIGLAEAKRFSSKTLDSFNENSITMLDGKTITQIVLEEAEKFVNDIPSSNLYKGHGEIVWKGQLSS
jgi:hypothetical protein